MSGIQQVSQRRAQCSSDLLLTALLVALFLAALALGDPSAAALAAAPLLPIIAMAAAAAPHGDGRRELAGQLVHGAAALLLQQRDL